MDCVIFSSWVPFQFLHRAHVYIDILKKYYSDCKIYVGVNCGSDNIWKDMLLDSGLNVTIRDVPVALDINSDASGYQAALQLYAEDKNNFSYGHVWFLHTKSISHPDSHFGNGVHDYVRYSGMCRAKVTEMLNSEEFYGGWSNNVSYNQEWEWQDKINEVCNFPYPQAHLGLFFLTTNFVIKNHIVQTFIKNSKSEFWTENMGKRFNRYFFEFHFPLIISKSGYLPVFNNVWFRDDEKAADREFLDSYFPWLASIGKQHRETLLLPPFRNKVIFQK